jgi:hypothetical protein
MKKCGKVKCRNRKISKGKNVETIYLEDKGEGDVEDQDESEGVTFRHFSFDQSLENHLFEFILLFNIKNICYCF